ncbi:FecR domain-containing protein [Dyadobacter psychrotolerans]|nr:FecR domain-containing protein [Dyadobacter psychrotolerans]
MTKEIIQLYFRNKAAFEEDEAVEEWLRRSPENTRQALKWLDELSDEEEKLFLNLVLEGDTIRRNAISGFAKHEHAKNTRIWNIRMRNIRRFAYRNAALLTSLVMIGFAIIIFQKHSTVEVNTKTGESKNFILPDGSDVEIRNETSLSYAYSRNRGDREIWLNGNATFSVKKLSESSEFTVQLPGGTKLQTISSEFNVFKTGSNTYVFVKYGLVKIFRRGYPDTDLKPGKTTALY